MNEKTYCISPFSLAEISANGNVYPCCPRYIGFYSFGNIYEQTFEEIWNSEKANEFRQKIINNDYSLCNKNLCVGAIYENFPVKNHKLTLRLAYDNVCNVACRTCRDKIVNENNDSTSIQQKEEIFKKIIPILKDVKEVQLSTSGDIFTSNHSKKLIKYISENYPNIKFIIDTNGVLITPKMYNELKLKNKIQEIHISLPGIREKTYNNIVRYGNLQQVLKNIKFLSGEKEKGCINNITIVNVIHKENYKDMPKIAIFAKKNNVNVFFATYQPWEQTLMHKKYKDLAVWEPENPEHNNFLKILSNHNLYNQNCLLQGNIKILRDSLSPKKSILRDFLDSF